MADQHGPGDIALSKQRVEIVQRIGSREPSPVCERRLSVPAQIPLDYAETALGKSRGLSVEHRMIEARTMNQDDGSTISTRVCEGDLSMWTAQTIG